MNQSGLSVDQCQVRVSSRVRPQSGSESGLSVDQIRVEPLLDQGEVLVWTRVRPYCDPQ